MDKKFRFTWYVDLKLRNQFKAAAANEGKTMNDMMDEIVTKFISEQNDER